MLDDAVSLRLYAGAGIFLLLASLETVWPALTLNGALATRWVTNISLYAINAGLAVVLGLVGWHAASPSVIAQSAGLFPLLTDGFTGWAQALAALLLLDLFSYGAHRLEHRVTALWWLHGVHHADVDLDATTGFRHHPGETVLLMLLGLGFSLLVGIPAHLWGLYAVLANGAALIQHANLRLPETLDRILRTVLVTPGMHRHHHAQARAIHDTNYGTLFSFWDRIFRTYTASDVAARAAMPIGLAGFTTHHQQTLPLTLTMPLALARSASAPTAQRA